MPKNILVIRFSALGDTAMLLPVLYGAALEQPDCTFTLLTSHRNAELVTNSAPSNLHSWGVNLKNYNGLIGLRRLHNEALAKEFDAVADMHDVLRTKILRCFFKLRGIPVSVIDKGRREKRMLCCQGKKKRLMPLLHTTERYAHVLHQLQIKTASWQPTPYTDKKGIGIAPFAKHQGKIYPLDKMEAVIAALSKQSEPICLFGGGPLEEQQMRQWSTIYPNVRFTPDRRLSEEIHSIAKLRVMLTMDSANMHLASLAGTRVISIWGAAHPFAGFLGYGQSESDCIQANLPCRPCSVFGNRKCQFGNYPCMQAITPQEILQKLSI